MSIFKGIGNGFKNVANIFFDDLVETEKEKQEKERAAAAAAAQKPQLQAPPQQSSIYNNPARQREHANNMQQRRVESASALSSNTPRVYQPIQRYTPPSTVYGSVRESTPPRTVSIPKVNDSFDKSHSVGYTDYGKQMPSLKTYTPAEKKKSEDAWYNKINHGSFKEDDWFMGMVRNQEKAENWYTGTYGEKEGKKEYLKLHNRLLAVPYKQHQKEAERFKDYTAEDFKVPVLQKYTPELVKFILNGKPVTVGEYVNNTLQQTAENRTTGCYKEGDENLPFLTNYIINGNDGKTGGLNKVWQNAKSEEEKARIERVAEMLRAETTDYDITKSSEALILLDADGANKLGHTAVIIKNSDGQGVYFSYAAKHRWPLDVGETSFDILSKEQMERFMTDGNMSFIGTSSGRIGSQHYTHYKSIPINSIQGASMIGKGIHYFLNPGIYGVAGIIPGVKQCDFITDIILSAGDIDYKSVVVPKLSFNINQRKIDAAETN